MNTRIRKFWHLTTWPERITTVLSPVMPILAALHGSWGEAVVWVIAGIWWSLYLTEKAAVVRVEHELWIRNIVHLLFVRATEIDAEKRRHKAHTERSSVRFQRGHR